MGYFHAEIFMLKEGRGQALNDFAEDAWKLVKLIILEHFLKKIGIHSMKV